MSSKKTETATFRIEEDILEKLRGEAKTDKISLNAFVNQIFSQFIDWYSPAKRAGHVSIPKVMLIKIMNNLSREQIVKTAEDIVTKEMKDIILVLRQEHSARAFLDAMESWAKTSNFPFDHEDLGGSNHKYVICHEMGKNWSLYFGIIFTRMFEELGISHLNFEITDKTLIFSFTNPN